MGTTDARRELDTELIDTVLRDLSHALVRRRSGLAAEGLLDPGLELQARSILGESVGAIRSGDTSPTVAVEYGGNPALRAHGRMAAVRDRDPAEPLMAAEVLFDVALKPLADHFADEASPLDVARHLHHAIWRRFPLGAIAYVEELRTQLRNTETEARLSLARELHDAIANPVAAARQRVELAATGSAGAWLDEADELLGEVLHHTRALASRLRSTDVGVLGPSIQGLQSEDARAVFRVTGVERLLPERARSEVIAVVREALRNTARHAPRARRVLVTSNWGEQALTVTITDDTDSGPRSIHPGLGMAGMQERSESIGAELIVSTDPRFTVTLRVPYVAG